MHTLNNIRNGRTSLGHPRNSNILVSTVKGIGNRMGIRTRTDALTTLMNTNPQRWCQLNDNQMYVTTKAFKTKNDALIDFITSDPQRWCALHKYQMDSTTEAFKTKNDALIDFITSDPQRWCQLNDNQMDRTTEAFKADNKQLTKFITEAPERWCDLDQMFRTIDAFEKKNPELINFITIDPQRWVALDYHRMYGTIDAFEKKNPKLTNFITTDPQHWCQLNADQMYGTIDAFEKKNPELTNFITTDPQHWCQLNDDQMDSTIDAFEKKNPELTNFITTDPQHWCQLNDNQMDSTIEAFKADNDELTNFIIENPQRWCGLDNEQMKQTLNVFTKIIRRNNREPITPADNLIHDVQEHLSAWCLADETEMMNVIAHYRPTTDNGARLLDATQAIHEAGIERDSHKLLKYLSEKSDIPTQEEANIIFDDFKTELNEKDNKTKLDNDALKFMDSLHFNSSSQSQNMTLKQLFALAINSADNGDIDWNEGITAGNELKNDIKNHLITALSDSQNAYDGDSVSCWGGAVNRLALVFQSLIKQEEETDKWSLPKADYIEKSHNHMNDILEFLHRDNTKITDPSMRQELEVLKTDLSEDKDNLIKEIYPKTRDSLLQLNRQDYPNVPFLIHSKALKDFDENVEYLTLPK